MTSYISDRALDDQLVSYLQASPDLNVPTDADVGQRQSLAAAIVNKRELTVDVRVRLAGQLVDIVQVTRETSREPELIAALMRASLLDDNANTFNTLARSVAAQEAFVATSPTVTEYFLSLTLSEPLLARLVGNPHVPDEIKVAIAENLPGNPAWQGVDVAEALGEWAQVRPFVFPADTVQVIHNQAAATRAKVAVLSSSAASLGFEAVVAHVRALPEPYSRLVERNRGYVDIPASPDFAPTLDVLEADGAGPVSSWTADPHNTRVWMRHPLDEGSADPG